MSGFEVAGVVLGAIPLVISALEHYKAGKGAAATFFKWRDQLDTLIYRLKLQRCLLHLHLMELLRDAGVEGAVEDDLTEEEILQILKNTKNEDSVREYLGVVYSMFLEVLRRYESCLAILAGKLAHIHRPADADDLMSILAVNDVKFLAFKKRVRFTIEKTVLKDLVEELREDRLSLQAIIKAIRTQTERTQREPSYEAKSLERSFEKVRENVTPLFNAICRGCTCKCSKHYVRMKLPGCKPEQPFKRRKSEVGMIFDLMLDQGGQFHQTIVTARQENIATTEINQQKEQESRNVKFPPSITIIDNEKEACCNKLPRKVVADLCNALCQAKTSSRVLQLELVNHNLLYDHIEPVLGTHKQNPPSEFLDLFLRKGYQNYDIRMTPKQQTLLALDVASSVLQLRQTCWLDADFRSTSMRFLLYENEGQGTLTPALFIERIVHVSKVFDETNTPQAPEPKTTLLELAIILLEIWHHQPLYTCINGLGLDAAETLETRRIAAIRWLERTSSRLPLQHLAAIEQCLAVCSGRLRSWSDRDFVREYCENIIRPLQESCKAW
ncbi:hypothetical protein F5B22DRAFT_528149 [Xylaria bambusicola]|uniref:uncharacterized protein n=1 Tax=Xylaria bambusicola TaxID=326684 RepID=UPI0020078AEA|nr:uncharacterized protein F5B22DRAFT_528149 [Xylaria bambusicola]KAI0505310.1 hypothetical protein F5B22DRAFT_528149 [Xylaria bambusicola]